MSKSLIVKVSLLVLAMALIAGGRGYWSRHKLAEEIKKDVAMGRYNKALESLEGVRGSRRYRLSKVLYGEDPYIAYNTGVVLMLMGIPRGREWNSNRLLGQTMKQSKKMPYITGRI